MTWFLLPFIVLTFVTSAFTILGIFAIILYGIFTICSLLMHYETDFFFDIFKGSVIFTLVSGIVALTMFGIAVGIKYFVG